MRYQRIGDKGKGSATGDLLAVLFGVVLVVAVFYRPLGAWLAGHFWRCIG
jgi:hypothetical protein